MTLTDATAQDTRLVKSLFYKAFPKEERPPFFMLRRCLKKGNARLLVLRDGDTFEGFVYTLAHGDLLYIFFLAVAEGRRGRGYGTALLTLLKETFPNHRLFLAREDLDPTAENYEERLRRHAFYLKNGFVDWPLSIKEGSVIYDVMGVGEAVTPTEYAALITPFCSPLMQKLIDMRVIEKQ